MTDPDDAKIRAHIREQAEAEEDARRYQDDWNEGRVTQLPDGTWAFWSDYAKVPAAKVPTVAPAPHTAKKLVTLKAAAAFLSKTDIALRKQVTRAAEEASVRAGVKVTEVTISGITFRQFGTRWMAYLGKLGGT